MAEQPEGKQTDAEPTPAAVENPSPVREDGDVDDAEPIAAADEE